MTEDEPPGRPPKKFPLPIIILGIIILLASLPIYPVPNSQLLTLLTLLLLSAFFSMSETALINLDLAILKGESQAGNKSATKLLKLLDPPEKILTTILVGNNVVNIGASVYSSLIATQAFGSLGPGIAVGGMTFLILIFSEITPKTLAVQHSWKIAQKIRFPLALLHQAIYPIAHALYWIAGKLLLVAGIKTTTEPFKLTQDHIANIVAAGRAEGEVEPFEHKLIDEVFDFTETPITDNMRPVQDICHVPNHTPLETVIQKAIATGYSRIIVTNREGNLDAIHGFIHIKDALSLTDKERSTTLSKDHVRPVLYIKPHERNDHILRRLQKTHNHLAIIQDKNGQTLGLITLEDLLEDLLGEIHDEHDTKQ